MTITLSWWMLTPLIITIGSLIETIQSGDEDHFVCGLFFSIGIIVGKLLL